jgi:hypothetical protein
MIALLPMHVRYQLMLFKKLAMVTQVLRCLLPRLHTHYSNVISFMIQQIHSG